MTYGDSRIILVPKSSEKNQGIIDLTSCEVPRIRFAWLVSSLRFNNQCRKVFTILRSC